MTVLYKGYARFVAMDLGFGFLVATFLVTFASRGQPDLRLRYLEIFQTGLFLWYGPVYAFMMDFAVIWLFLFRLEMYGLQEK